MELLYLGIILNQTKMKNIKDIVIGIFAVVGFAAIVTGFTNETSDPQYPESHVWEAAISPGTGNSSGRLYMYNKVTGEVRKYNKTYPSYKMDNWRDSGKEFLIMKNVDDIPMKK